jgi:hypothetical protein
MSMDDRRWLVPKVSEVKKPESYWEGLHHWLLRQRGLEKIRWWAKHFKDYVKTGQDAPMTSIKRDIIEESQSEGQRIVASALQRVKDEIKEPVLIADLHLQQLIMDILYEGKRVEKLESPHTVRAIAKQEGFFCSEARVKSAKWPGTINKPPRIICTNKADAEADLKKLSETRPLFDIVGFYKKGERL